MNKSMLVGSIIGAIAVTALGSVAGYKYLDQEPQYAEVVSSKAVIETYSEPVEQCKDVIVQQKKAVKDENQITGTVLGAVVGGVLGNQIGGGSGKKVATVAAAATASASASSKGVNVGSTSLSFSSLSFLSSSSSTTKGNASGGGSSNIVVVVNSAGLLGIYFRIAFS